MCLLAWPRSCGVGFVNVCLTFAGSELGPEESSTMHLMQSMTTTYIVSHLGCFMTSVTFPSDIKALSQDICCSFDLTQINT